MLNCKRTILLTLLAILTIGTFGSSSASAQTMKIGIVNDEDIKAGYDLWIRAQEEFDLERKAWDDEAQTQQSDLREMIDEYERQKLILSEEKRREKETAIRVKEDALNAFTRQVYGPGGTAEKKQEQLLMPLLDNVSRAIQAIAENEGYDVIFTMQSGLGYIKPSYDITSKVLDALDEL